MGVYKNIEVDIELEIDDILEYISRDLTKKEHRLIKDELINRFGDNYVEIDFSNKTGEGSLCHEMKLEILSLACKKFTLSELEKKLGTKFELL
jgi:hypothetical protein